MSHARPKQRSGRSGRRKLLMILDVNPQRSRYNCLLSKCDHKSASVDSVLSHFWKFKSHNGPTKKCTGQNSSSLHIYPSLFDKAHSNRSIEILSKEYSHVDWSFVSKCINSHSRNPDLCSLIRDYDFMITGEFVQRYPNVKIPDSLKGFILDSAKKINNLPATFKSAKRRRSDSNSLSLGEPPLKKRKLRSSTSSRSSAPYSTSSHSTNTTNSTSNTTNSNAQRRKLRSRSRSNSSTPNTTLILPSLRELSPRRSSRTNSIMDHLSTPNSTGSISFDVNHGVSSNTNNSNNSNNHNSGSITTTKSTNSSSSTSDSSLSSSFNPTLSEGDTTTNTNSNTNTNDINKLSVFIPEHEFNGDIETVMMIAGAHSNSKSSNKKKKKKTLKKRRKNGPLCSACNKDINPCSLFIRCTECTPSEVPMEGEHFDDIHGVVICTECFKIGREFARHKRFHRYRVIPPCPDMKVKEQSTDGKSGNDSNGINGKMEMEHSPLPPLSSSSNSNSNSVGLIPKKGQKSGFKAAQLKAKHNRWTAEEDWNLLYGLRRYGLGNWVGISRIINKSKSDNFDFKHVESHFTYKYGHCVHRKSNINGVEPGRSGNDGNGIGIGTEHGVGITDRLCEGLDAVNSKDTSNFKEKTNNSNNCNQKKGNKANKVSKVTVVMEEKKDGDSNHLKVILPQNKIQIKGNDLKKAMSLNTMPSTTTTTNTKSGGKLKKSKSTRNRAMSESHSGNQRNHSSKIDSKFTAKHRVKCGYREHRDEFEAEWNNDAESMIANMFFSPYDTPDERQLKMEGLRLYNKVLEERKVRKEWVKQHGVQSTKRKGKDAKLEEEIFNNLAKFARFTDTTKDRNRSFSVIKDLAQGLMEEKRLRERIQKLKHYMLNGVTSISVMEDIEKYTRKQKEFASKLDVDDMIEFDAPVQNADAFLNRYSGFSLDSVSRYLKLREKEEKDRSRNRNKYKGSKWRERDKGDHNDKQETERDDDEEMKDWTLSKFKGFDKLSEGEGKLCNRLKVKPTDLQLIKKEIGARIGRHGLLRRGVMPNQIWIDIGDVNDVKQSMTTRIGLVDPQIMPKLKH